MPVHPRYSLSTEGRNLEPRYLEHCESLVRRPDCEYVYFTQLLDLVRENGPGEFVPVVHPGELLRAIADFGDDLPAAVAKLQALKALLTSDGEASRQTHRKLARQIETMHRRVASRVTSDDLLVPSAARGRANSQEANGGRPPIDTSAYELTDDKLIEFVDAGRPSEGRPNGIRPDGRPTDAPVTRISMGTASTIQSTVRDLFNRIAEIGQATIPDPQLRPTIAVGVRYRQEWCSQGYNRGDLIRSIPLTADARKEISVKTWRVKTEKREDNESVEENISNEYIGDEKWSLAVAKQTSVELNQSLDARLKASGDVTIPVKKVPVKLGAEGGAESSTDVNFKNTITETEEAIKNTTVKAANSLKNSVSSSVETSEESGFESTVTDTIVNPNKCNTLTYNFFEIIESFRVTTKVEELLPFVMLPLGYPNVTKKWLLCHECLLRKHLPCSDFYSGFDAARRILANERLGLFTAEGGEGEGQSDALLAMIEQILASYSGLRNASLLPPPPSDESDGNVGTWISDGIDFWLNKGGDLLADGGKFIGDAAAGAGDAAEDASNGIEEFVEDVEEFVEEGLETAAAVVGGAWNAITGGQQSTALFASSSIPTGGPGSFIYHEVMKIAAPEILAALAGLEAAHASIQNMPAGAGRSQAIYSALQAFFATIGDVEEAFRKVDIGLLIALLSAIGVAVVSGPLLAALMAPLAVTGGAPLALATALALATSVGLSTATLTGLFVGYSLDTMADVDLWPDDRGLKAGIHGLFGLYQQLGHALNLSVLPPDPTPEQVAAHERMQREQQQERLELAEAQVELERLTCHIKDNIAHYFQIVAGAIPTADVARIVEEKFDIPPHTVELKFSHFVGNRVGLRVLDNAWLRQSGLDLTAELKALYESHVTDDTTGETEIVLPTRGMLVEPMLGECHACDDFIMAHREKDLTMKDQEIAQTQLETERLRKRIDADLLGDPTPFDSASSVSVDVGSELFGDE